MTSDKKKEKTRLFSDWTHSITLFGFVGFFLAVPAAVLLNNAFGYTDTDTGTYFVQTAIYCAAGSIIVAVISLKQLLLLRRKIKISSLWILACVGGIIISESIAGLILWKLEINRAD